MRMNEIAEQMPILFKLKVRLKRHKSQCYKDLILFMCELLKNYKEEVINRRSLHAFKKIPAYF